ncbi:MAG: OmpA family protein [Helicobacter sp.]|nr:OmpA family protein [Helicobacter sp.]
MKKLLVLSSLAAALLVTGCSVKTTDMQTQTSGTERYGTQPFNGSRDNFVSVEDRIDYIEAYLQNVFFDFDKFNIRPDMKGVIDNDAMVLTSIAASPLTTRIEGNTDEWGTDEYNYALGLKRAVAVRDALVAKGVSQSKIILVSYGESKPTCTSKTEACWAENRKVTFKMLP